MGWDCGGIDGCPQPDLHTAGVKQKLARNIHRSYRLDLKIKITIAQPLETKPTGLVCVGMRNISANYEVK